MQLVAVSYTHLRAHETPEHLVCRLLLEKKWLFKWEKIKFKNKKNVDLWLDFLSLYKKNSIKFHWIKGHNNHPQNERCDKLAFNAASGENLFSDTGYEGNDLNTLF